MPLSISNNTSHYNNRSQTQGYIVKSGDTLGGIVRDHGVSLDALKNANPQVRGDLIQPGQQLNIPDSSAASESANSTGQPVQDSYYRVQSGDSLNGISRSHGIDITTLLRANPQISDPGNIHPNDQLIIPGQAADNSATMNNLALLSANNRLSNSSQAILRPGSSGPEVTALQDNLNTLGFDAGNADGSFGAGTQAAVIDFQRSQSLVPDGKAGADTLRVLDRPDRSAISNYLHPSGYKRLSVYPPGSPEQIALFTKAADIAGVPKSWASDPGLLHVLSHESHGKVGVPNYTYGQRVNNPSQWPAIHNELRSGRKTATSSATGLGQLLLANVDAYYPSARNGIGDPLEEAVGMLRYIKARHRTPSLAWQHYNSVHEGY